MKKKPAILSLILGAFIISSAADIAAQNNIAEEVAWVVGDQPIWKSEIEEQYRNAQYERLNLKGDPYCVIPENMAIEKLFLHQADIDTVEVQQSALMSEVENRINVFITSLGSKEKMEEYFHKSTPEIRQQLLETMENGERVRQVQRNLTKDIRVTPSDVRRYFNSLPADSIPFVPLQVEAQIITINPNIPREEIEDVKARLRGFTERVNNGESDFSTLAILYSEDPGSAVHGGEIGFRGRAELDPEYAAVAFNLNDPKRVSKIVESQYGYHIIQLIEKRGDRINTRHILLQPKVSDADLTDAVQRLDSLRSEISKDDKLTFEMAVPWVSQDKDTRANGGRMINPETGTTLFEMSQLPQEVALVIDTMKVGDISPAFVMRDEKLNREVVALVKLSNRVEGHKADLSNDYQMIKMMYENAQREDIIRKWLEKKIAETYVRIEDGWRGCDFTHKGWIKERKGETE